VAIRFVAELQRQAEQTYNNLFTYEQLYQIAQGTAPPKSRHSKGCDANARVRCAVPVTGARQICTCRSPA